MLEMHDTMPEMYYLLIYLLFVIYDYIISAACSLWEITITVAVKF